MIVPIRGPFIHDMHNKISNVSIDKKTVRYRTNRKLVLIVWSSLRRNLYSGPKNVNNSFLSN